MIPCSDFVTLALVAPNLVRPACPRLRAFRVSFGLKIERDLHFTATHPITVYADAARQHGGIVENDEALVAAAMRLALEREALPPSIPPDGG